MFISPSKLRKNMILKNRILSFETTQKNFGNMVLIPTLNKNDYVATLSSELFRPTQLMCLFVERRIRPMGRNFLVIDQKDYYEEMRVQTNNKLRKGKTILSAYAGQNLVYDLYKDFNIQKTYLDKRFGTNFKMVYSTLSNVYDESLLSKLDDSDYKNVYLVFPMGTYIDNIRPKIMGNDFSDPEPSIIFLRKLYKNTLSKEYNRFAKIIFYNPNAKALVTFDLNDSDFEDNKPDLIQKIIRLNNFNNGTDKLDDLVEDELSDDDLFENKKEELKTLVFKKIAKTLRAENLTDFEAAGRDEQELMLSIDEKIENYLKDDANKNKTFADMVADIETDNNVKMKAIKYVEFKKAADQRLNNLSKGLEKETEIIGSIQDLDDYGKINAAADFKVNMDKMDERIEQSHLASLDEEYNQKQAMTDLTSVVSAFSNSDYLPITVDSFELNDSSDYQNTQKTLNVRYKTDDGKPLSFQIDIPDIVDKRFLYLGGNKKFIKKQLVRLPIVKTKSDRVEITTNFNKMTIERTSGKLYRRNEYLLKKLKTELGNNPAITVEYGNNTLINSNRIYVNDFEYEELAGNLNLVETPKYKLIFNRDTMEQEISLLDISDDFINNKRTPIGFEKKGQDFIKLIYIENSKIFEFDIEKHEIKEISSGIFNFIIEDVCKLSMATMPSIGKSFVYTTVKFLGETYPLFAVVASQTGLTDILKRYNVEHYVSDRQIKGNIEYVEVKFKDKYLYYKDEIQNSLLLSPLYLMNTKDYELTQFDTDIPYTHYFMRTLGDAVGIYVRNTLRINLQAVVDPITRDVLRDLKLPTNIIDILLYANSLLVGNQYKTQNDITNYRIRGNEIIAARLYKVIADAYIQYQKHRMNGRAINLSIPKNSLIRELNALENINDKTTLNPVIEAEQIAQISAKGFSGVNINSAYTLEMRAYDKSMNGFLSGNSTPYSGQAGITRALAYDPKISSVRGYIPYIEQNSLSATNMLSPTELLAPFTSACADAPRQAMQVAQSGHSMPVLSSSKQLIGSGVNKTLAFMISDDFCFKAKKPGIIEKYDSINEIAILKYDDGTSDAIDLSDKLNKNSNMGFYIHQKFTIVYDEGERFKAGDVIAYNPSYFSGKGRNVDYHPGTLAKVAIAAGDFAYEDSTLISESLSKKCAANINMLKQVVLGKNAQIHSIKNIGDTVEPGEALIEFTSSFEDPETTEFLNKLSQQLGQDEISNITHEEVKSKYSGKITNIEIFYNCPFEELNETLQNIIKKYKNRIAKRQKALEGVTEHSVHIPPIEQTKSRKIGKEEFPQDGGLIINIWVEYESMLGMGDKITYSTALKGVVSRVLTADEAPLTEYREEEPIEAVLTPTGVISRMTLDVYSLLYSNKVLVELGKQIRETWRNK